MVVNKVGVRANSDVGCIIGIEAVSCDLFLHSCFFMGSKFYSSQVLVPVISRRSLIGRIHNTVHNKMHKFKENSKNYL